MGLGDLAYNEFSAEPWPVPLWLLGHAGNTLGAVAGAWLIRLFVSRRPQLSSVKDLIGVVVLGGFVGTSLSALVGAAAIHIASASAEYGTDFISWYASDLLGVILFTPLTLAWWRFLSRRARKWPFRPVGFLALQAALVATLSMTFYFHLLRQADSLFVSLPFVIWAAARYGLLGATFSILLSTITVNWFAAHGYGPFALAQLSHPRRIIENLVSQGVFAFAGLLPAAVFSKLRETQAREAIRTRTMTLLSGGAKLGQILSAVIHGVEDEDPELLCSIELLDQSGQHLRLGAAPSLPPFFCNSIHGVEIGPEVGCSGPAAHLNRRIVAMDIRVDPRWSSTRELAETARLRSCWAEPFHDSSGRVIGTFSVFRREPGLPTANEVELVSSLSSVAALAVERKNIETQFLRAQRMESIGTLAGGIAHDLNNLLTPIALCTTLLRDEALSADCKELVESIHASTKRGAELVKQVLTFSRGIQGTRIALNLRLVVNEVGSIASKTFPKSISFLVDMPRDLPLVSGDSTQLEQVLMNLCLNARDAMPAGGSIKVSGRVRTLDEPTAARHTGVHPGTFVELAVVDTGCGMAPEVVDRIFEPFFTTKELGNGTGLGLSTSLGIMRAHGGFIEVESQVGRGSTFRMALPAVRAISVGPEDAALGVAPRRGRGEGILLVDDEAEIRKAARLVLTSFGYTVTTAGNGAEALNLYVANRAGIRLVVTDLMMPIMDGAQLIDELRQLDPGIPIITLSGLRTDGSSTPDGSWHHMSKPFPAENLAAAVAKVLDEASARRESRS